MSSPLLLQSCPACLVHITWIVFVDPHCLSLKILKRKHSAFFIGTCLVNDLLPKYTIYKYIYIHVCQPLRSGRIWHKVNLSGLNSEFFFSKTSCLTKAEEPSLPYYLPIAGGRIIGFIPFPRVLVRCEMQSVSFRIWTRVAVSISYDDNHYTTESNTS